MCYGNNFHWIFERVGVSFTLSEVRIVALPVALIDVAALILSGILALPLRITIWLSLHQTHSIATFC